MELSRKEIIKEKFNSFNSLKDELLPLILEECAEIIKKYGNEFTNEKGEKNYILTFDWSEFYPPFTLYYDGGRHPEYNSNIFCTLVGVELLANGDINATIDNFDEDVEITFSNSTRYSYISFDDVINLYNNLIEYDNFITQ